MMLGMDMMGGGRRLPRNGLLLYLARPNSDEYLVGEDTEIGEDTYIWGYVLPDDADIRAATGWVSGTANVFYGTGGTPIVALATEIAQAVLPANVVFSLVDATMQTGKLAIYTAETTVATLAKARSILRDESINYLFYGRNALFYDPQDLATMYQDAAGTLPAYRPGSGAVDPPVGLLMDKSGGEYHASQTTPTASPKLSGRYNLLTATETLSTQSVTTAATDYTLRFEGTGTVTLSGTATGVLSAGTHTLTCTVGVLMLTVAGSVTKADLRVKRDGSNLPPYQRVDSSTTYDTAGFPLYLWRDKTDDDLIVQAPAITGSWAHGTIDGPVLGSVAIPAGEYHPFGETLSYGLPDCTQWIAIDGALSASEQAVLERYVYSKGRQLIDVPQFGSVSSFVNLFRHSPADGLILRGLDVSRWDTSSVTTFATAFYYNHNLIFNGTIDVSSKCVSLTSTFFANKAMQSYDISGWDCTGLTSAESIFNGCTLLETVIVGNAFDNTPCTNFTNSFVNTKLNQESIDAVLVSINTAGTSNGTFNQSGGSAPSATGQAAIIAMRSRGWTVTVTGGF